MCETWFTMVNSSIYIDLETIGPVTCIVEYMFVLLVDSLLFLFYFLLKLVVIPRVQML